MSSIPDASPPSPRRRLGPAALIVLGLAALVVTVVIGMVRTASTPADAVPAVVVTSATPAPTADAEYVHVSGAVRHPGLYLLPPGARLVDAVSAAGGFTGAADRDGANLAREVVDGEQVRIPARGETAPASAAPGAGGVPATGARINLNTADEAALESLPRIGPALAGRIIAWRTQNGRFTSVDDLLSVSGIGDKMLAGLKPLVTV